LFTTKCLSEAEIYAMALHRDIFWVGKQWAVTGYGMQAVDQKQKSKFDIEASRLWEEDLLENLSAQRWFNAEDFNAGLSVARAKYPEAPGKAALRKKAAVKESAPAPVAPSKPAPRAELKAEPKAEPPKPDAKSRAMKTQPTVEPVKPAPKVEPPKPETAKSEAAPAPSKLAFTGGTTKSTLTIDAKARSKKRAPAQFNLRIEHWPAKFTRMWRVRINQQ
jgi:outer membrane biosynthesis protein TonB